MGRSSRLLIVEIWHGVMQVLITMVILLGIVQIFTIMDVILIWPQIANRAQQLGFSLVQIGMMGTVYLACEAISAPIFESLSVRDISPNFRIFVICSAVRSLAYYCLGVTSSVFLFFVVNAVIGCLPKNQVLIKALLQGYDTREQDTIYNKYIVIAGVVAPVVSGHVVDISPNYGFSILTFVMGTMFAINTGLIALIPEVPRKKKEKSIEITHTPKSQTLSNSINEFYSVNWPKYWDIFLYQMLIALTIGLYFSSVIFFLTTEHGLSSTSIGFTLAVHEIVRELTSYYSEHIINLSKNVKDYTKRTIMFTTMTLTFIGLASASDVFTYLAILIPKSICDLLGQDICIEMISRRSSPDQKDASIGVARSVKTVTMVLSPIIASIIAQYVGITYTFYIAVLANAIGAVISYKAYKIENLVEKKFT